MANTDAIRAPRNRTLSLSEADIARYKPALSRIESPVTISDIQNKVVCQDLFTVLPNLPDRAVDLVFADPPYNLTKNFNDRKFKKTSLDEYSEWLDSWLAPLARILKPTASIYICGDWRCSAAIDRVGGKYFIPQNRITWEREKGRLLKAR